MTEELKYRAEGARLKRARKLLKLTQDQLAQGIGSSLATVKSWERGNSRPNRTYGAELARRGINLDYVESGEGEPLIPPQRKAAWDRLVDRTLQDEAFVVREPMAQLRSSTKVLEDLCQELDFTPSAWWMMLVQELMVLEGLSERGARRILETLKLEKSP